MRFTTATVAFALAAASSAAALSASDIDSALQARDEFTYGYLYGRHIVGPDVHAKRKGGAKGSSAAAKGNTPNDPDASKKGCQQGCGEMVGEFAESGCMLSCATIGR